MATAVGDGWVLFVEQAPGSFAKVDLTAAQAAVCEVLIEDGAGDSAALLDATDHGSSERTRAAVPRRAARPSDDRRTTGSFEVGGRERARMTTTKVRPGVANRVGYLLRLTRTTRSLGLLASLLAALGFLADLLHEPQRETLLLLLHNLASKCLL